MAFGSGERGANVRMPKPSKTTVFGGERSDSNETPRKSKNLRGVIRLKIIPKNLFTDTESFDNGTVSFDIVLEKIVKELSSLTDHLLHTSAGVVVLGVLLEMLGELSNSLGKNSDLYFGRTGVALVNSVFLDELLLEFLVKHDVSPFLKIFFRGKPGKRLVKSGKIHPCALKTGQAPMRKIRIPLKYITFFPICKELCYNFFRFLKKIVQAAAYILYLFCREFKISTHSP